VTRYLLVRLYSMALTLAGLTVLIFLMLRLIPGTVVEQMIGADAIASPAMVAEPVCSLLVFRTHGGITRLRIREP